MKNSLNFFVDYQDYEVFSTLTQTDSTKLLIIQKKSAPSKKYLLKIFNFECCFAKDQKIILDTFYQISNKKNQYVLSYKHFSFSYGSKLTPAISMRYISSKTLENAMNTPNIFLTWKITNIMECLFAVAESMNYLHNHLIYHGNLCPSNIIIDEADQFYICDFGLYPIKKLYIDSMEIFNSDYKDPYMNNNDPTFKNDIYSFGVLMCHLFHTYYQMRNNQQKETLREFLLNTNRNKYNMFPRFCSELIPSCLNSFVSERPSFKQILDLFKSTEYDDEELSIPRLYEKFKQTNYISQLALKKNSTALNKLGQMYENGTNVDQDHKKAMEYYKQAADLNNSEAQNNYGVLLQSNASEKSTEELQEGAKYLQKSAEQGNLNGMANYGIALLYGHGVTKNIQKAEEYLKKSADLGSSFAQANYGYTLLDHNPTLAVLNEGLKYLKKAMNQQDPDAYYKYGLLLQKGEIFGKNDELAMEYFKISADNGHDKAMIEYAKGSLKGVGVPKSKENAIKYFQMAAGKGNKEGKTEYTKLTKKRQIKKSIKQTADSGEILSQKNKTGDEIKSEDQLPLSKSKSLVDVINKKKDQISTEKFDNQNVTETSNSKQRPNSTEFSNNKQKTLLDMINQKEQQISNSLKMKSSNNEESPNSLSTDDLIKKGDIFFNLNDISKAFLYYKTAADRGDLKAILKCAEICPSFEQKLEFYELAAKNQTPESFSIWRSEVFKRLSLTNDKTHFYYIGQLFENHDDFSDAAYAYSRAKDKINFQICYEKAKQSIDRIGDGRQQYIFGIVARNQNEPDLARYLFTKALQNGESMAKEKLDELDKISPHSSSNPLSRADVLLEEGIDYYEGKNGKAINCIKAMELFMQASKLGCPKADFYIGDYNKNAFGAQYLKKSALSGDPDGQTRYAYFLKNGIGVQQNLNEAMHWYQQAADQGNAEALFEYGREAYERSSSQAEVQRGELCLKKAAEKLYPDAIYYYSKFILQTNPSDSSKFYEYALSKGSKLALEDQRSRNNNNNIITESKTVSSSYEESRKEEEPKSLKKPIEDEFSKRWFKAERERVNHLLQWFGWDRWDESQRMPGVKRSIIEFKLASRAFLRFMLSTVEDTSKFRIAFYLLDKTNSTEFDPNFESIEKAIEDDDEFLTQLKAIDNDFIQQMESNGSSRLKRIEFLFVINKAIEMAHNSIDKILIPQNLMTNLPASWWTPHDDQCLIYGVYKYGFAHYKESDFMNDSELTFTCKQNGDTLPSDLSNRLRRIVKGIKNKVVPPELIKRKSSKSKKVNEISVIFQKMMHDGVYLNQKGELDWSRFRKECGFDDKTDDQIAKCIDDIMKAADNGNESVSDFDKEDETETNEEEDDDDENDTENETENESKISQQTAQRIKQRFNALIGLRQVYLKYSQKDIIEYLSFIPRWRRMPSNWTPQLEYLFMSEVAKKGFGHCNEIVNEKPFYESFNGSPPSQVTCDKRVMNRIKIILKYINKNSLESLRNGSSNKTIRRKTSEPKVEFIPDGILYNEKGQPILPINVTSTLTIISLGRIVTDRNGFHTERYIYPAGFKSSKIYMSCLNPSEKVHYICEIIDNGNDSPLFRVTMIGNNADLVFEGMTPTAPWSSIVKKMLEQRCDNTQPIKSKVSGPEYFGLSSNVAAYLIQKMPGAKECKNYVEKKFVPRV